MNKKIDIYLAGPRGFCAGVDRAIEIVKKSINKYGSPVYVRHEIVHNNFVVERLRKQGAIFVEELTNALKKSCEEQKKGITTFIEVILNQELGEPFRRDAMKKPVKVAGINPKDMRPQKNN